MLALVAGKPAPESPMSKTDVTVKLVPVLLFLIRLIVPSVEYQVIVGEVRITTGNLGLTLCGSVAADAVTEKYAPLVVLVPRASL
jgi:hypothetical protein